MDMKEYLKVLSKMKLGAEAMFGDKHWTYQHDGASAHNAKSVNNWLEENTPDYISSGPTGEWPANILISTGWRMYEGWWRVS
jgi:hypothetical protein